MTYDVKTTKPKAQRKRMTEWHQRVSNGIEIRGQYWRKITEHYRHRDGRHAKTIWLKEWIAPAGSNEEPWFEYAISESDERTIPRTEQYKRIPRDRWSHAVWFVEHMFIDSAGKQLPHSYGAGLGPPHPDDAPPGYFKPVRAFGE